MSNEDKEIMMLLEIWLLLRKSNTWPNLVLWLEKRIDAKIEAQD